MNFNYDVYKSLDEGTQKFIDYQMMRCGDFYFALFDAIMRADETNKSRLAKAFPEEVQAVRNYQHKYGWWEYLRKRLKL